MTMSSPCHGCHYFQLSITKTRQYLVTRAWSTMLSSRSHVQLLTCVSGGVQGKSNRFTSKLFTSGPLYHRSNKSNFIAQSSSSDNNIMNTLKNLVSGAARASSGGPQACYLQTNNAPSWDDLERMAAAESERLGISLPKDVDLENGPPNPLSLKRTFGSDKEPRIKLYRDHAAWCPYCHKVVLQLEEKRIPYIIEKINMRCYGDKPKEFLQKVPSGLLPVLEVDGHVITESAVIQSLLEEWFPHPALLPPEGTEERDRASSLMRLERQLFGDWLQYLCNGWGDEQNRARFEATMDQVEKALGVSEGPYFLSTFSLVDIIFAPFLERIVASIPYYKGVVVRGQGRWPNLETWFTAMETRPAYMAFKSDFYTHCHDLPPQLGGCVSTNAGKPVEAVIDGLDGKSWHLPLTPITETSLEPLSTGDNPEQDRFIAASKLIHNHTPVVRFALRGVGSPGSRPVSAPLSDPTATPGMEHEAQVDAALRHVAHLMLTGKVQDGSHNTVNISRDSSDDGVVSADGVPLSLGYLRDRVGVPRDMPLPAARQFRAHLNWMIDHVQGK